MRAISRIRRSSFADDILVFSDGKIRSIEGIVGIFERFAKISGLKISIEKSTIYLAGVTPAVRDEINQKFSFSTGTLPVRYLGLPLLTRKMTSTDYQPLLDILRARITSWTTRFLSIAGRLQLIRSVLMSISNFWLSAFRLPNACLKEIERLCSAFLWSGPSLNSKKAKISWEDVCKRKEEGGLGLRPLVEVNNVFCLKLIWRIVSSQSSLWANWIKIYLIRKDSFWYIKQTTTMGSWMWRKILKTRSLAREFHKVQIGNGESASFWFDIWSEQGCLYDKLGSRGVVDLGIPLSATVATAWTVHRRRRHRTDILSQIETDLENKRRQASLTEPDIPLWRSDIGKFKVDFNAKKTWLQIRSGNTEHCWSKGIWFKHSTPKYSIFTWLTIHNRLATGERMSLWNVGANTSCVFCRYPMESRDHLFFTCGYSAIIWAFSTRGILRSQFTTAWDEVLAIISGTSHGDSLDRLSLFLFRYALQATIHILWRERNARRHGEVPNTILTIQKMIDKQIRNRCTTLEDPELNGVLQLWFSARRFSDPQ